MLPGGGICPGGGVSAREVSARGEGVSAQGGVGVSARGVCIPAFTEADTPL